MKRIETKNDWHLTPKPSIFQPRCIITALEIIEYIRSLDCELNIMCSTHAQHTHTDTINFENNWNASQMKLMNANYSHNVSILDFQRLSTNCDCVRDRERKRKMENARANGMTTIEFYIFISIASIRLHFTYKVHIYFNVYAAIHSFWSSLLAYAIVKYTLYAIVWRRIIA